MSHESSSITPEQLRLSNEREKLIEKARAESGLDDATFEEMVNSFNSEPNDEGGISFSFKVRGHEIKQISHTGTSLDEKSDILYLDGVELSEEQAELLHTKYSAAIMGLANSNIENVRSEILQKAMDDVLK